MKGLTQHILEKLKVTATHSNINDKKFFDAIYNYCKINDVIKITALDVYTNFNDIPEIIVDRYKTKKQVNFALYPRGKNEIENLEVWLCTPSNEPEELLTNIKANDAGFNYLVEYIFDINIINDIYDYCA